MSNIVPFNEMQGMADAIAKSGLFGMKDTNSVLALMAVAQAEGLHPATAARDYHIIQGKPALKADAMLARFQAAGGKVEWHKYTDQEVEGTFTHPNGGSLTLSWTLDQAQRIGLVKPGSGWQKFPRAMLRSRVVSEGIRTVYPGCVIGTYSPEEVADFEPTPRPSIDMGKIEPISPEQTEAIAEVVQAVENEPEGAFPLYLPDGSIYSRHASTDDWCAAYSNLNSKIFMSEKLSSADKATKVKQLRDANDEVHDQLSNTDKLALTQVIAMGKSNNVTTIHGLKKV